MNNIKKIKDFFTLFMSVYHYKNKSYFLPYLPGALWIEPTNVCNLKCIMCPNSLVSRKKHGYMKFELYKKIIDEAKDFVNFVTLCISGESLLHPKFPEMVAYAKKNGIYTYLSTNCTVLTPELSKKILVAGLDWIVFSFDGCSKEIYEKVRAGAKFEKSLQNVIDFLKIKKALGAKTRTELSILGMDEEGERDYQKNIGLFKENFKDLPLDYLQKRKPSTWGGYFLKTKKYQPKKLSVNFSPCSYLWSSFHILWDGKVVACTSDFFGKNVLGKFPEKSLKDIWNDFPMRNFRRAMVSGKYLNFNKNCKGCDSLWEKPIFGFPAGIRGIDSIIFNNLTGGRLLGILKKIAKKANDDFPMETVKK